MDSSHPKKKFPTLILGIALFLVLSLLFLFWYSNQSALSPDQLPTQAVIHFPQYLSDSRGRKPKRLTVVTYNMGYASGEKTDKGRVLSRDEVRANLNQIVDALKALNPDILLLQEVDFFSRRSFDTDQFQYLVEKLEMPFGAYIINWNKKYVAWPYWPLTRHFGRIVSGQAVLSRFPIKTQKVIVFDKPKENPFWYNWFYIDRAVQILELEVGKGSLAIFNLHLEAFATDTRQTQLEALTQLILKNPVPYKVVGGDFNMIWAAKNPLEKNHPKEKLLLERFAKTTHLKMADVNTAFLTYPSWDPSIDLDHLFFSGNLILVETGVQTKLLASDHLPVWTVLKIP